MVQPTGSRSGSRAFVSEVFSLPGGHHPVDLHLRPDPGSALHLVLARIGPLRQETVGIGRIGCGSERSSRNISPTLAGRSIPDVIIGVLELLSGNGGTVRPKPFG